MEVSGVQGKPQLHKKFKNNLGYICGGGTVLEILSYD